MVQRPRGERCRLASIIVIIKVDNLLSASRFIVRHRAHPDHHGSIKYTDHETWLDRLLVGVFP
jgi:hypothetical protein